MICTTAEEYVDRAVTLGNDRNLIDRYREKLHAARDTCTLFDMPGLVRRLEDLYAKMWSDCENGQLPQPDLANLDIYLEVGSEVKHDEVEVQTISDYRAWWTEKLMQRHKGRPILADRRFVSALAKPAVMRPQP